VASETLGVGHRAGFYEQTGALRDVLQGHLLQLLSLVLMNIPDNYVPEDLPTYRLSALEGIDPVDPSTVIRSQYDGYQEEVGNIGSTTETFVSLKLTSHDQAWQGVPMRLTTGKELSEKKTAITISYKDGMQDVFEETANTIEQVPGAYGRVLIDAINGNKSIFTTSPEIIRAWEILAPLQKAWQMNAEPLTTYEKGSTPEDLIA
jgi:glucose-6-phosphate 1-dehydrogenase